MTVAIFEDMHDTIISEMDDSVETVTYTPKGGTATSISAILFRAPPVLEEGRRQVSPKSTNIRVYFRKSDVADVNINSDTIAFKRHIGDSSTETFKVRGIVKQDVGSFTVWVV